MQEGEFFFYWTKSTVEVEVEVEIEVEVEGDLVLQRQNGNRSRSRSLIALAGGDHVALRLSLSGLSKNIVKAWQRIWIPFDTGDHDDEEHREEETELEAHSISNNDCFHFFGLDPRSQHANAQDLAAIAIDIVTANVTAILEKISDLIANEMNPVAKAPLLACYGSYSAGNLILKQAKNNAGGKNFEGSSDALAKYPQYPRSCINAYVKKGIANPVAGDSNGVIRLASIAKFSSDIVKSM